jgi:hypothetical protein
MPPAMQTLGIDFFKSKDEEYRAQRSAEGKPLPEKEPNSDFNFDTHFIKAAAMDSPLPAPMGNIRYRAGLGKIEVFEINRAIVMNAANLVSSVEADDWVVRLVELSCG